MRSRSVIRRTLLNGILGLALISAAGPSRIPVHAAAPPPIPSPEQFFGFRIGSDNKLARWDKIVDYMKAVSSGSDRVRYRELGKTTDGNAFVLLEISSPDTLKNLDRYQQLERKLYFQGGAPSDAERDEIFRQGKLVLLITCSIHATEIGASQMSVELVHRLATDDSPAVKKILDNVIFLLVPSLNPDGQIMVTDWFTKNVGTPYENSPIPYLYHPYVGHDNNRDMYMFTQKESQLIAQVLWKDWFPSVWLDEHQQGSNGARIFVMPATDPINSNVHPLIYRWNGILGQSQAAALEAAGKEGIIYNSTYTNFWQGAMAWSGWWHNQVGLLTEVASARVAAPIEQRKAQPGQAPSAAGAGDERGQRPRRFDNANEVLPPPRDVTPRTEYPRPWLGGRWTLRDIVDYELIATMALLDTVADRRETLLRQIYDVNAATLTEAAKGDPSAFVIPVDTQHDPNEAAHLVEKLQMAGVEVSRAQGAFEADGKQYAAGTFVVPISQVFGRYAKDILEKQTYPEVRRTPSSPPDPPYDVTAWSLGMLLGVETVAVKNAIPEGARLQRLDAAPRLAGSLTGNGTRFVFDYRGPDAAAAINSVLSSGGRAAFQPDASATRVSVSGVSRKQAEEVAMKYGLTMRGVNGSEAPGALRIRAPRIGMYQPWTGGNMDEGWTRWVLEQYGFKSTPLHNAEVRAGGLKARYDAIIIPDQQPRDIIEGFDGAIIRPEYKGGIGDEGVAALKAFVADGGTLITLGAASDFAIDEFPVPVRDLKRGVPRDQHFAPGTILRVQVDTTHPVGYGMNPETYGFYNNSPF
ncbi:MAG: M14 family zinc carboxypeptidase, partial [Acidobacteriota bacterium]